MLLKWIVFSGKTFPRFDQPFVNRVELVSLRAHFLKPKPLSNGGLEQGGGGVGVIFEQFRRARVHRS